MVGLLAGKGLALAAGKPLIAVNHLEGHALSPRLVDPDLDFPYLLLLVSAAAIASCSKCAGSATTAGWRRPSTMPPARRSTRPPSCSASAIPAGRRSRRWPRDGDPSAVPLPRPLVGIGRAAFLLRRPQERGPARGGERAIIGPPTSPPASSRRWSIASSTAPRARSSVSDAPSLVVAGGVAANARGPLGARSSLPSEQGRALLRAARLAVHRQCGDDRLGRGRALRGRADRRARRAGAGALAARPRGREGARRGGEGMTHRKAGGDRRRRLGHRAGAGRRDRRARDLAVGARGRRRGGGQPHPRESGLSARASTLDPAIRATSNFSDLAELRRLAGGHPGAAYARGAVAARPARTCR